MRTLGQNGREFSKNSKLLIFRDFAEEYQRNIVLGSFFDFFHFLVYSGAIFKGQILENLEILTDFAKMAILVDF